MEKIQLTKTSEHKKYKKYVNELGEFAKKRKEALLAEDFSHIIKSGSVFYFKKLVHYYMDLCLFPDDDIISKFKQLKLNKAWLLWMISLKDIEAGLNTLTENHIQVDKYPIIVLIRFHLQFKILATMQEWFNILTIHEQDEIPMAKKVFLTAYRNRPVSDYGLPKTIKDKSDLVRHVQLSIYEQEFGGRKIVKKELLQLSSGNTDQVLLKPLIGYLKKDKKLKLADYCNLLYDFFLLIKSDDEDMYKDEDEFLAKTKRRGRSFRVYKTEFIHKKFIREL